MARKAVRRSRVASLHDEAYARFVGALVLERKKSGLSQQAVADKLGWQQSIVAKIETAQRRIDIVELIRFAGAVGFDAAKSVRELRRSMIEAGEISE